VIGSEDYHIIVHRLCCHPNLKMAKLKGWRFPRQAAIEKSLASLSKCCEKSYISDSDLKNKLTQMMRENKLTLNASDEEGKIKKEIIYN